MRKHLLSIILLSFTVSFLYANWEPLPNVPEVVSDGGCITYGGGYIWAVVVTVIRSLSMTLVEIAGLHLRVFQLKSMMQQQSLTKVGLTEKSFLHTRIEDGFLIYQKDKANSYEGEWNEEAIELPDCSGPGVSLAYVPCVEKGIQRSGYL
jgi:hypothetical protein